MLSWHSILKIKEKNLFFQYDSWNRIIKSAKPLSRILNIIINAISTKKKKFVLKNRLISQLQWKKIPNWGFLDTFLIKALESKDRRCRMSTQSCSRTLYYKNLFPSTCAPSVYVFFARVCETWRPRRAALMRSGPVSLNPLDRTLAFLPRLRVHTRAWPSLSTRPSRRRNDKRPIHSSNWN